MKGLATHRPPLGAIEAGHLHRAAEHHSSRRRDPEAQAAEGLVVLEGRLQRQLELHGGGGVIAQRQGEVVGHAVVAVGRPGGAGVEGFEFGGLHLAGAQAPLRQRGDRPGDRRPAGRQHGAAWIGDPAPPGAAHLHAAHPGVDHRAAGSAGGGLVFLRAQGAVEDATPHGRLRRPVVRAEGRQHGQIHRGLAGQAQLQVAAVEQGIEAPHRQGQHHQRGEHPRRQAPFARKLRAAAALQQLGGHPAAGARPHRLGALLGHQGGQGQKGGGALSRRGGLGEGGGSAPQTQLHRRRAPRGSHHRQPEGGIEALWLAGEHVVAEQLEAPGQGHVEVGGAHPQRPTIPAAAWIEAREQDPLAADQLGVVVVHQQHPIQAPRQGFHPLAAQHGGGALGPGGHGGSGWSGRSGGDGSLGSLPILGGHRTGQQNGQQGHGEDRPPTGGSTTARPQRAGCGAGRGGRQGAHDLPTSVRDTVAAMARISSAERGSLKGPFTRKAATARWPFGSWMRAASA